MQNKRWIWAVGAGALGLAALGIWWSSVRPESYALPKPKGYFKIALPDTASDWISARDGVGAGFRLNRGAQWKVVDAQNGWVTLRYPSLGAEIQLSYVPVKGQLNQLLDDSYQLAFKHDVVAQGIQEKQYADPSRRVYGLMYQFKGNTATPCQFFVTDSTRHFLRGSVYVMAKPNADSLAPVNAFLREEVIRLMETTRWQ